MKHKADLYREGSLEGGGYPPAALTWSSAGAVEATKKRGSQAAMGSQAATGGNIVSAVALCVAFVCSIRV